MNKTARGKSLSKLTAEELDAMSAEFDREFVADTFGPMPPSIKRRLGRARKRSGRPQVGAGAKAISVTVEKTLLQRIDRLARHRKTTRAQLISRGLQAILKEELATAR